MDPVAFANVLEESPLFDCIALVFIGPLQSMSSEQQLVRARLFLETAKPR